MLAAQTQNAAKLHALACNLANFLRTMALPDGIEKWSMTRMSEKLVKIGAELLVHGRYMLSRWRRSPHHAICSAAFFG
jgi:hypothetical protein